MGQPLIKESLVNSSDPPDLHALLRVQWYFMIDESCDPPMYGSEGPNKIF